MCVCCVSLCVLFVLRLCVCPYLCVYYCMCVCVCTLHVIVRCVTKGRLWGRLEDGKIFASVWKRQTSSPKGIKKNRKVRPADPEDSIPFSALVLQKTHWNSGHNPRALLGLRAVGCCARVRAAHRGGYTLQGDVPR